jgi:uncharacterized membrane protein YjjB (DUF3815 family)
LHSKIGVIGMLARIRKAIVAGIWGGLTAVGTSFVFTGAPTRDQIGQMLGAFIVGAAATGFATWKAKPNAPAVR